MQINVVKYTLNDLNIVSSGSFYIVLYLIDNQKYADETGNEIKHPGSLNKRPLPGT